MNKFTVQKATCEKYTIKFNDNWDWAIFTIDNTGMFNCQSSFGNYNYQWSSFGECFKKFLIKLDSGYLYSKLCEENYFDSDSYIKHCKHEVIRYRKGFEFDKNEARELYDLFNCLSCDSFDLVCEEVFSNSILSDIFCGEVFNSEFAPEKGYSPNQTGFIEKVYPMFVEVLKNELKEEKKAV